jgi:hypothetical protein
MVPVVVVAEAASYQEREIAHRAPAAGETMLRIRSALLPSNRYWTLN